MTAPRPHQLSRQDLDGMTPASIEAARRAGQLADILAGREAGTPPTCPTCGSAVPPAA